MEKQTKPKPLGLSMAKVILVVALTLFVLTIIGFIFSSIIMKMADVWAESAVSLSYLQRIALTISDFFITYGALLIWLWIYAYIAFCLQTIAIKTNTKDEWLAWIPIANLYLVCKTAGRPGWWFLLCLIPLVNIIVTIILWMEIAKARNEASWLGILTIIPIVNFIVLGYLAFSE